MTKQNVAQYIHTKQRGECWGGGVRGISGNGKLQYMFLKISWNKKE